MHVSDVSNRVRSRVVLVKEDVTKAKQGIKYKVVDCQLEIGKIFKLSESKKCN